MNKELNRKLTPYVSIKMTIDGKEYKFIDKKTGEHVEGKTVAGIKLVLPKLTVKLLPFELKAIIDLHKDKEFMDELESRIKAYN